MNKKSIVVFLSIVVSVSLCACGSTDSDRPTQQPQESSSIVETESTSKAEETVDALEISGNTTDSDIQELTSENDTMVDKLISLGFTEDEASQNAKILKQCGVPSIELCEPTDPNATIDGLVAYRGKLDDDRIFWFTVDSREIFYVALNGEDLYDKDLGGYLKNFADVHIPEKNMTEATKIELRDKTEKVLDKYFSNSTRYYDAWGFAREDNSFMVRCQISDGSILTDGWLTSSVWYEQQDDGSFVVVAVKINGKFYELKE